MSDSDLSSLSSVESIETDEELEAGSSRRGTLDKWVKPASPPAKRKRPASPPHQTVPEDNPDIAFIVMFRARFNPVFPKSLPNFGPQDIERGVFSSEPDDAIEKLLCALIGLALNRKKDVERAHYTRPLEEALSTFANQWPKEWLGKSPLAGGASFATMSSEQRILLLKSLALWSLQSSEAVRKFIADSYKGQRHEDDFGQPLAVQPWGRDGDKRRYWLIEGLDDTYFRVYRESNPALKTHTWWSVADSIESVKALSEKLREEGSMAARKLADGISTAIPRFEAGEEKRKRREYRLARKAQFSRPEAGMSLYEGRTRGKRMKYTFSDEEDMGSDEPYAKRSRASGISTPTEPTGPVVTASGRQVRARGGGIYGESLLSGQRAAANGANEEDGDPRTRTRSGRASGPSHGDRANGRGYDDDDGMEESDVPSSEWNSDKDDDDIDDNMADIEEYDDEEMSDEALDAEDEEVCQQSKMVTLKVGKTNASRFPESDLLGADHFQAAKEISPAGSTIILDKAGAKQDVAESESVQPPPNAYSALNGMRAENGDAAKAEAPALHDNTSDVSPQLPQHGALKMEELKPVQAPTPPLSDTHQHSVKAESGYPT